MAKDKITLFRQALAEAGVTSAIDSPDETRLEAAQCRLHYDTVRDVIFGAAYWPELSGYSRLATLATRDVDEAWVSTDPAPGWLYAFAQPSDCVRPRYMADYSRFQVSNRSSTAIGIDCNSDDPILFYTRRIENISLWSMELFNAVKYGLAAAIVMPLTRKPERAKMLSQQSNSIILNSRLAVANSDESKLDVIAEWHSARGYSGGLNQNQYFYPYGPLLNAEAPLE